MNSAQPSLDLPGKLFVVAAPSGAGKTSLVKALVTVHSKVEVAISHTTRDERPNEKDGVDYFFVDEARFNKMVEDQKFAEWARVFGFLYGTSIREVERILAKGNHLILEIDWQGAAQIRKLIPGANTIFILPPSLTTLHERLTKRAQDDAFTVQQRMDASMDEISHFEEFDYLLINDDFDAALADFGHIVDGTGEHLRMEEQKKKHAALVTSLL